MQSRQIILASASPRRKELLEVMGLAFRIIPSRREEVIRGTSPGEIVENLSFQKAEDVISQTDEDVIVIGCDTIVVCGSRIMGKPHTEAEAYEMINGLQGRTHEVYTGVTIMSREKDNKITHETFCKKALVTVHSMEEAEIWEYVKTGESMDKAGAYGIQGKFGVFVDEIQGEDQTILGLPIAGLYQALKKYY